MRDIYRVILTLLTALLALGLILGFWPFSRESRGVVSLLVLVACGITLWHQRVISLRRHHRVRNITHDSLPPEDFQGAIILACGDSAGLFDSGARYRETRQGWYLQVEDTWQLEGRAQQLSLLRPALVPQISVLLAILPEHYSLADDFTQCLQSWKRAIVQCRSWLGEIPPIWTVTWVSPLRTDLPEVPVWFTTTRQNSDVLVHQPGQGNLPVADWINEKEALGHISRLSQGLWLDNLLHWQNKAVDDLLMDATAELPALRPCARGLCRTPVSGLPGNLWQQHIAGITTLPPETAVTDNGVSLPELLLTEIPRRRRISQNMLFWGYAGLLGGIFLGLAMLASYINNQRFLQNVSDNLALYHHLNDEPPGPKFQVQQSLRANYRLLDDWQRQGEPLRYRMGLYQGPHLVAPIESAVNNWAPPLSPTPMIQHIEEGAKTVRLDSMSLFDSGQFALKPGANKVLIH